MKKDLCLLLAIGLVSGSLSLSAQNDAQTTSPPPVSGVGTNTPSAEVVPLVTIDDAPLPDAIRTLARQANINFQFDPRVISGAPGPDGKVPAQPVVSFRWENVTALQALMAVLENHNLQLIQDPKTQISRITYKDPAAQEPLVTRVVQLKYSNPTNVIAILAPTLSPRSKLLADSRTGQLLVLASENEIIHINQVLERLDAPPTQILMEAKFIETTKNPKSLKGIDWTDTLSAQRVNFGNNAVGGVLRNPKVLLNTDTGFDPNVGYLNADGVSAVLSFLNSDAEAESIASPRAVALEGVQTELSVVRNVPVFEEQLATGSGGGDPISAVKPNYDLKVNGTTLNEVGIKLLVTPRVYGGSNVFLDLRPEISDVEVAPAVSQFRGAPSSAPIFARRRINTQAMVPSGNTLVLGGLVSDNHNRTRTKIPVLGDLPGVGHAFRRDGKERNKRNLVIFVTPTILEAFDYQDGSASREFLQTPALNNPPGDWSKFDSAEPHDWSKPVY